MAYMGIIPEAPSAGTQLARGLGGGLGAGLTNAAQFAQQMALQKQGSQSAAEQLQPNPAAKALDDLEALVGKKGIGFAGGLNPQGEARYNRGMFNSLQSSLLPLFKSMFPRGMTEKEFKFINENYIPQASDTEETIKGKIAGLRQLMGTEGGIKPGALNMQKEEKKPMAKRSLDEIFSR